MRFDGHYLRVPDLGKKGMLRVPSTLGSVVLAGPVELLDPEQTASLLSDMEGLTGRAAIAVHPEERSHCLYGCLAVSELEGVLLSQGEEPLQVPSVAGVRAAYPMRARGVDLSLGTRGWVSVVRHREDPCPNRLFVLVEKVDAETVSFLTQRFHPLPGAERAEVRREMGREERLALASVGIPERMEVAALERRMLDIEGSTSAYDGGEAEITVEGGEIRVDATSVVWRGGVRSRRVEDQWEVAAPGREAQRLMARSVGGEEKGGEVVSLCLLGAEVEVYPGRREAEMALARDAYAPRLGEVSPVQRDSEWVRLSGKVSSVMLVGNRFTGVCYWSGRVELEVGEIPFCIPAAPSPSGFHDVIRPGEMLLGRFLLTAKVE